MEAADEPTSPQRVQDEVQYQEAMSTLETEITGRANYHILEEQTNSSLGNLIKLILEKPTYELEQPLISEYVSNSIFSRSLKIDFLTVKKVKIIETYNSIKLYYQPAPHSYN